jgi:histidine phosphotransferase ChpT
MTAMLSATQMAALVASKVCHDLGNSIGSITNCINSLDDPTQADQHALFQEMLRTNGRGAFVKMRFLRLATGSAMMGNSDCDLSEGRSETEDVFEIMKPELVWRVDGVRGPRDALRCAMNLIYIMAEAMPRGGTITFTANASPFSFTIACEGPRIFVKPHFLTGFALEVPEGGLESHLIHPYYAAAIARDIGLSLTTRESEGKFDIIASRAG